MTCSSQAHYHQLRNLGREIAIPSETLLRFPPCLPVNRGAPACRARIDFPCQHLSSVSLRRFTITLWNNSNGCAIGAPATIFLQRVKISLHRQGYSKRRKQPCRNPRPLPKLATYSRRRRFGTMTPAAPNTRRSEDIPKAMLTTWCAWVRYKSCAETTDHYLLSRSL